MFRHILLLAALMLAACMMAVGQQALVTTGNGSSVMLSYNKMDRIIESSSGQAVIVYDGNRSSYTTQGTFSSFMDDSGCNVVSFTEQRSGRMMAIPLANVVQVNETSSSKTVFQVQDVLSSRIVRYEAVDSFSVVSSYIVGCSAGGSVLITPGVSAGTATVGQVLTLVDAETGGTEFRDVFDEAVYIGEVAYLNVSGDDSDAEIGNPFKSFETLNQVNALSDSSFISIEADQRTYANSPSFNKKNFVYNGQNGSTYNHYLTTTLVDGTGDGDFLMKVSNLSLDTSGIDGEMIAGDWKNIEFDIKNVNAVRTDFVNEYGNDAILNAATAENLVAIFGDVQYLGCSFIAGTFKNVSLSFDNVVFQEDQFSNSNVFTEAIFIERATGTVESNISIRAQSFKNKDTDDLKRGFFVLSGTSLDTFVNSSFTMNVDFYESEKIANRQAYTSVSTSGNPNRFAAEQVLRSNFVNTQISYNYELIKGSNIHQFYPLDNSNADLFNSSYSIDAERADVRYSLLETWPNHYIDAESTVRLRCGECKVTNDVAFRLNSVVDGKVTIYNSSITTDNTPVIYPRHDVYLQDVDFFNNGSFPLIDAPTPITVYLCNTNVTRDRVGANVTLVYCEGQGEHQSETFTATATQTDFTVSAAQLPSDPANVSVYNDAGAKLRLTDHYTYVAATGVVTLITPASAGEKYTIEYFQ